MRDANAPTSPDGNGAYQGRETSPPPRRGGLLFSKATHAADPRPTDRRINMAGMVEDKDERKPFMHSDCDGAEGAPTGENREIIANSREDSPSMSRFV